MGFLRVYKLYIRMRIRKVKLEEQILLYVQGRLANIWKKNIKTRKLKYVIVEEFLADIKKEFGGGDNEIIKVTELKRIKQGSRTMKEFV